MKLKMQRVNQKQLDLEVLPEEARKESCLNLLTLVSKGDKELSYTLGELVQNIIGG